MSDKFDPYIDWLGISPVEGPADHYALLGVKRFETDNEKIKAAADSRMELLRKHQNGRHSKDSQELLNVISSARICLLNKDRRAEYDKTLRKRIDIKALPPIKFPPAVFPDEVITEELFPLKNSRVADLQTILQPVEKESASGFRIPHIPIWVYFTVVGIASVLLAGYALFVSVSSVGE